ncbi:MFS transporter [Levilactobacillus enshiensis]|uniref:MFS transporter n=1 Tax=Levilactobacillus enshiensis TaxID=2590213 RepID=UPI00117A8BFA|nr:MFS transporter [Levilactobacillus enshiensis]
MSNRAISRLQMTMATVSLFIGSATSEFFSFALGLYVLKMTASPLLFSVVAFVGPAAQTLLTPLIGYLVDKFPRKLVALTAQATSVVIMAIFVFNIKVALRTPALSIILLVTLLNVCDGFQSTSYKASSNQMVMPEDLQKLVSLEQLGSTITTLAAPILGGILYSYLPLRTFSLIELGGETVVLLFIMALRFHYFATTTQPEEKDDTHVWESFKQGLTYIKTSTVLRALLFFIVIMDLAFSAISIGLPFITVKILNIPNTLYGIIQAATSFGMILGSLVLSFSNKVIQKLPKIFNIGLLFCGLLAVLSFVSLNIFSKNISVVFYIIILMLVGLVIIGINIPFATFIRKNTPDKLQGRVNITVNTTASLSTSLGVLLFGVLFGKFSPTIVFAVVTLFLLAISIRFRHDLNFSIPKNKA